MSDDRVAASRLASAIGDALGAGVFKLNRQQIAALHPPGLAEFVAPPSDNYLNGMTAGEVTDGTSQLLLLDNVLGDGVNDARQRYADALRG